MPPACPVFAAKAVVAHLYDGGIAVWVTAKALMAGIVGNWPSCGPHKWDIGGGKVLLSGCSRLPCDLVCEPSVSSIGSGDYN